MFFRDAPLRSKQPADCPGRRLRARGRGQPPLRRARDGLARFAELIKSPEHAHTYRVTPLSIWNACAAGVAADEIVDVLVRCSKSPVPEHVAVEIRDFASRYGRLQLTREDRGLVLDTDDAALAEKRGVYSTQVFAL
ncbi:MAG: helicase-associated domain-containing protein [Kiritimatiellae bacterium]|nr:helicase-associated domain-containing protein [Kiritimatiellia bacterium]